MKTLLLLLGSAVCALAQPFGLMNPALPAGAAASSAPNWTPDSLSGLSHRWVAQDYNAATGTWKDRVGGICYGPYSTFGKPAASGGGVCFDGTDDGLRITNCTDAAAASASLWLIFKQTANAPSWTMIFGGDNACSAYNGLLIESNVKLVAYYSGYSIQSNPTLNALHTAVWSSDGKFFVDGGEIGTRTPPATFHVEWVGRSLANAPFHGYLYEAGVVGGAISPADAGKLHTYATATY